MHAVVVSVPDSAILAYAESGTRSIRPRAKTTGVVREARPFADGGNGSRSIPNAFFRAGVVWSWMTGPPSCTSGSHMPFLKAVAWTSTSSPVPPTTGSSWHSPHDVELNKGPRPV